MHSHKRRQAHGTPSCTKEPEEFETIIEEHVDNSLRFNVMPNRPVEETLHIRQYRITEDSVEAHFDRTYKSSILKSPSHLIFLSAVAHTLKMLCVYACHRLGLPCDPKGPEVLNIWPTTVHVEMPRMMRNESDILHRMHIDKQRVPKLLFCAG